MIKSRYPLIMIGLAGIAVLVGLVAVGIEWGSRPVTPPPIAWQTPPRFSRLLKIDPIDAPVVLGSLKPTGHLSSSANAQLSTNYWVIVSDNATTFSEFFTQNSVLKIPILLTFDSVVDIAKSIVYKTEITAKNTIENRLSQLSISMLFHSVENYYDAKNPDWRTALRQVIAYTSVGTYLLDPTIPVPKIAQAQVLAETHLIYFFHGKTRSPVENITPHAAIRQIDYTTFYGTRLDKSIQWYQAMTFDPQDEGDIRAMVILGFLSQYPALHAHWSAILAYHQFVNGYPATPSIQTISDIFSAIYGPGATLEIIETDRKLFYQFKSAVRQHLSGPTPILPQNRSKSPVQTWSESQKSPASGWNRFDWGKNRERAARYVCAYPSQDATPWGYDQLPNRFNLMSDDTPLPVPSHSVQQLSPSIGRWGMVEPNPVGYARLAEWVSQWHRGSKANQWVSASDAELLADLLTWIQLLRDPSTPFATVAQNYDRFRELVPDRPQKFRALWISVPQLHKLARGPIIIDNSAKHTP